MNFYNILIMTSSILFEMFFIVYFHAMQSNVNDFYFHMAASTHWGLNKMSIILQTTFSDEISQIKSIGVLL